MMMAFVAIKTVQGDWETNEQDRLRMLFDSLKVRVP